MTFYKFRKIWWTNFQTHDISFGMHICWKGRVDIHFLCGMLSLGRVPIYKTHNGKLIAVSNSYHSDKKKPFRAGIP